jgi:hypothetical protein
MGYRLARGKGTRQTKIEQMVNSKETITIFGLRKFVKTHKIVLK